MPELDFDEGFFEVEGNRVATNYPQLQVYLMHAVMCLMISVVWMMRVALY